MEVFDGRSDKKKTLLKAFGLGGEVEEADSLKSKDFLIISRKMSIFSLCFICTEAIIAAIVEETTLEIKCYMARSIVGRVILKVSS